MPIVAAPAIVIAALFALLFLWAWQQWRVTIVNCLDISIPFLGKVIAYAVDSLLTTAYAIIVYYLDRLVNPLYNAVLAPLYSISNMISAALAAVQPMGTLLAKTVITTIPAAATHAMAYSLNLTDYLQSQLVANVNALSARIAATLAAAEAYTETRVSAVIGVINYVQANVIAFATAEFNQAVALIHSAEANLLASINYVYTQTVSYAYQQGQAAIAYAEGVAATAARDTAHALAAAESYATTAATQIAGALITDVQTGVAIAVDGVWPQIDAGVIAVEGVIATDLPDIGALLKAVPRAVPGDIAGALAGVTALSLPMLKYLEQCGIPNCRNLSQLGRDLQALLGLVEDAAFLALIIELIREPEQAAATVEDTFGGILSGAVDAARSLLSV